jgi:hypothetical protein
MLIRSFVDSRKRRNDSTNLTNERINALTHDRHRSTRLLYSRPRAFRRCMNTQCKFLRDGIAEHFHRTTGTHDPSAAQRKDIITPRLEKLLERSERNDLVVNTFGRAESSKFRLPTDKGRLPPLEAESAAFPHARLLPLGASAGRGAAAGTVAAGDSLARSNCTPSGTERVEHGGKCTEERTLVKEFAIFERLAIGRTSFVHSIANRTMTNSA